MIKKTLGFCAVLALLYGAAWTGAAFWFKARLDTVAADLTAQGYAITRGETLLVGFPTTVGVMYRSLNVSAPTSHGGWRWDAGAVRVTLQAQAPTMPVIDLAGSHRLTGFLSAPEDSVALEIGRGTASLAFAADASLESMTLKLSETTVTAGSSPAPIKLADGTLHLTLGAPAHATLSLHGLTLPQEVPALGRTVGALDLALDVTGPLTSGPLRASLEAWRDAGGALEVRSFTLAWGPAQAAGTGTIALDGALQPLGAATVKFQGFFEIVSALTAEGYVREREASLAKIVLEMLARPSAAGAPELSLPLTVQDRKLSAGPVMLMEIPEVVWSDSARVP